MKSITQKLRNTQPLIFVAAAGFMVVIIVVIATIVHGRNVSGPKYSGPVVHITTAMTEEYGSLVLVADKQGYFKDQGIYMTIKNYASGSPLITDLLAGKLDCGIASDFAGVLNTFHHQDVRILASVVQYQTFFLVARKDHGIHNVSDIKGKRIGVTKVTAGEFFLGQFLTFNNLQPQDITLVDEPPASLAADLENGSLDGAVLFEPNAYPVSQRLGVNTIQWSVQDLQPGYGILYCSGRLVRENPAALVRYMRAIIEAQSYIQSNSGQARDYVATYLGYNQGYIDYIWPRLELKTSLDQALLINMDDEARWAIENHATDATEAPNYLDFIYFPPLAITNPGAITIIH